MSILSQREVSITQLTATQASGAVVLIRLYVGLIFVGEGILKFLRPETLGPGRFEKSGIPASTLLANLDGIFEIGCGVLILVGLLTRLAAVPMIVDMIGALAITKLPILWGNAPLYPKEGGFWDFFHEGRQRFPAHRRRGRVLARSADEPHRHACTCHRCSGLATHTAISKVDSRTVTGDREPE